MKNPRIGILNSIYPISTKCVEELEDHNLFNKDINNGLKNILAKM